jgi:hypothetical protein
MRLPPGTFADLAVNRNRAATLFNGAATDWHSLDWHSL